MDWIPSRGDAHAQRCATAGPGSGRRHPGLWRAASARGCAGTSRACIPRTAIARASDPAAGTVRCATACRCIRGATRGAGAGIPPAGILVSYATPGVPYGAAIGTAGAFAP